MEKAEIIGGTVEAEEEFFELQRVAIIALILKYKWKLFGISCFC